MRDRRKAVVAVLAADAVHANGAADAAVGGSDGQAALCRLNVVQARVRAAVHAATASCASDSNVGRSSARCRRASSDSVRSTTGCQPSDNAGGLHGADEPCDDRVRR